MKLRLSGTLLRFVDYQQEVELDVATLAEAIGELAVRYPPLRQPLLDGTGTLRGVHRLFLNSEQLAPGTDLAAEKVGPDDTLEIVTALAGG